MSLSTDNRDLKQMETYYLARIEALTKELAVKNELVTIEQTTVRQLEQQVKDKSRLINALRQDVADLERESRNREAPTGW